MTQPVYPTISAVITAYNSAAFIRDAIESVLRQTIRPAEIIIVDDGSTDATLELVCALGMDIRYFYQDNRGGPAARNQGVALARGETIAFLDADDAWLPNRLADLSARIIEEDAVSIVCGRARAFKNEAWTEALESGPGRAEAFLMSFGCALIRRHVFNLIGPVDVTLRHGEDLDWFLRCREQKVPIATIDDVVLLYRRHEQNMTRNFVAGRDGLMRTVKELLDVVGGTTTWPNHFPPGRTLGAISKGGHVAHFTDYPGLQL